MRSREKSSLWWKFPFSLVTFPLWFLTWPLMQAVKLIDERFLSYLVSRVVRDKNRIYTIKFIWYGDSIYLHPMIWGSVILYFVAQSGAVATGWLLLYWFIGFLVCYVTVIYNFNVIRTAMLAVGIVALLGATYFSTMELAWNPLADLAHHVKSTGAEVSPGFFLVASYFFAALIVSELVWAWLFNRVEIDESYVYEHRFMWGTTREPIFARALRREIKDLLELLVLGAADIEHRTRSGYKRFKNVPFASLWLGAAIDSLLDHRRPEQVAFESKRDEDAAELARLDDALHDDDHGWEDPAEYEEDSITAP